ncbi:CCR4-Not complex caf1 ribonuclease subunit Caf1 [Cichlidogyrus casuarinus]|uniref:CCR4-Not complex caf1 ribonuclease subunit Caf1 n=1 Tax=Cichlidogyrus casuarinus TaxID=1844966 RepID=A0ABD2QHH5_9PLAT
MVDENYDEETEYSNWKQNAVLLYDFLRCNRIDWPSMTCEWIYSEKDEVDKIIIGTTTPPDVYVYDTHRFTRRPLRLVGQRKEGYGISWRRDAEQLLTASYDGCVYLWNIDIHQDEASVNYTTIFRAHTKEVGGVDWNKKSDSIFASVGDDKNLFLWDTRVSRSNEPVNQVKDAHDDAINCVAFHPNYDNFLVTAGVDKMILVWDTRNLSKELSVLEGHDTQVNVLRWCPHKDSVLASSSENRILIWDLERAGETQTSEDIKCGIPQLIFSHAGHQEQIYDFAWSPRKMWEMCSTSNDSIVQLWKPQEDVVNFDADIEFDLEID